MNLSKNISVSLLFGVVFLPQTAAAGSTTSPSVSPVIQGWVSVVLLCAVIVISLLYIRLRKTLATQRAELERAIEKQRENEVLKQSHESCLEKEARFRALSDSSPDIIIMMDRAGAITYANPAWEKLLGHTPEEVIGHYFIDFAKENDQRIYRRLFKDIRDNGKGVNNFIGVLLAKDGSERTFNMYGTLIVDTLGQPMGIVSSMKDFTEYKELEDKLYNGRRLKSIGTLAGGVAHDFNNLLMGIQGYTSLILANTPQESPNRMRLDRIEELINRGANLTRQLLGFAREGRYEQKPNDINKIIDQTATLFGSTNKDISFNFILDSQLPEVEVDQGQMEQMLMNLLVNAGQAMPDGGDICIRTNTTAVSPERAEKNEIQPGDYVQITIRDNGAGMDSETLEHIFDPFFTTKGKARVTGLGLATVYGIVKGHRGMIEVDSEPGRGTCFHIYLPAIQKKMELEKAPAPKDQTEEKTILLVDDENAIRETTAELLSLIGYRVLPVGSGQAAIATYMEKRREIDLVLLDMIMPGISGGTTFDRLREIDPDVRVLLASGYSFDGQANEIINRGCRGFIQKPFRMEELALKIQEVLR